jgi:hypothetical protein
MIFELDEQQQLAQTTARRFAREEMAPTWVSCHACYRKNWAVMAWDFLILF